MTGTSVPRIKAAVAMTWLDGFPYPCAFRLVGLSCDGPLGQASGTMGLTGGKIVCLRWGEEEENAT
jgi:hypothetical protein